MVESSGGEFSYLGNCIAISDLGNRKTNIHQIVDKNENFWITPVSYSGKDMDNYY